MIATTGTKKIHTRYPTQGGKLPDWRDESTSASRTRRRARPGNPVGHEKRLVRLGLRGLLRRPPWRSCWDCSRSPTHRVGPTKSKVSFQPRAGHKRPRSPGHACPAPCTPHRPHELTLHRLRRRIPLRTRRRTQRNNVDVHELSQVLPQPLGKKLSTPRADVDIPD